MNRDAILEVKHLSKSFGANAVLKDIYFVVHPGLPVPANPHCFAASTFWRHRPPGMWYFMETAWWIKRSMRQHTVQK